MYRQYYSLLKIDRCHQDGDHRYKTCVEINEGPLGSSMWTNILQVSVLSDFTFNQPVLPTHCFF